MPTITARLPTPIDEDLRRILKARGEGPSEGVRRIVEEWWVGQVFKMIEFKDAPTGRRAAIRGGPDVWEVVSYWREYGDDKAGFHAHFGWTDPEALEEAIEYYHHFREEIDRLISANEQYERFLRAKLDG